MRSEQPVRCSKCYLRMESYELRAVLGKNTYHQHCFLLLIREKAAQEKAARPQGGIAGPGRRTSA